MPNPAVIPAPLALILFALLAAALVAIDRYLRGDTLTPWTGQAWTAPAVGGRHRPDRLAQPLTVDDIRRIRRADRAKATVANLVEVAPDVIVFRDPLALEAGPTTEIAGLPDRQPVDTGTLHIAGDVPEDIAGAWDEAHRESWARRAVAAAGESWETHHAKFDGTVVPRTSREDTRDLAPVA